MRLWVAAADYGQDVSVSDEILDRTSEAYRRIRNTFRFLLSNLYDFDPQTDRVAFADMPELDRWAMAELADLVDRVTTAYDDWRFHVVYRAIYDYVGDLSSAYLDVLKDRLYADAPASHGRRSAQTVLAEVLGVLVRLLAPILTFTSEEVWDFMPAALRDADSVQLTGWARVDVPVAQAAGLRAEYATVFEVREVVTKALEDARGSKTIGKSQEAVVIVTAPADVVAVLESRGNEALAELFIVAGVRIVTGDEVVVMVEAATGEKCPRCWNLRALAADSAHPTVCARCAAVLSELEAS